MDIIRPTKTTTPNNTTLLRPEYSGVIVSSQVTLGPNDDIQSTINNFLAAGTGGSILLNSGTYVINNDINLPSDVTLEGASDGSVLFVMAGAYSIKATGSSAYSVGTISVTKGSASITGAGTAWLSNLTTSHKIKIDGLPYSIAQIISDTQIILTSKYFGSTTGGLAYTAAIFASNIALKNIIMVTVPTYGIVMNYADLVTIDNVTIVSPGVSGISLANSSRLTLDTVVIDGAAVSGLVAANTDLMNCTRVAITNCGSNGFDFSTCSQVIFTSCPADNNGGNGFLATSGSRYSWMICEFNQNASSGISLAGSLSSAAIIGGAGLNNTLDGIRLADTVSKATVSAGFIGTGNGGYAVNISAAGVDRTSVVANQLSSNTTGSVNNLGTNTVNANNQT